MSKHRYTNAVGIAVVIAMLGITVLCMFSETLGVTVASAQMPYVEKLFATDRVHTLDIVADDSDWQGMLASASAKEYIPVSVVIDGEAVKNVAIRTKGNSSLATMVSSESDRYSFKIEFDHYETGKTYHGLDKLALNNIIQDNTYLKDYLCYQMMGYFGADAPLCSFIWITVNGEAWGLYLAVEGIEEAFAERNYGAEYGQIYKPDSMNMMGGGGRDEDGGGFDGPAALPTAFEGMDFEAMMKNGEMPEMPDMPGMPQGGEGRGGGFGGFGGMGSSDVKLVYTDDDYASYANIFDNAKFDITDADRDRLIASLKQLGEGENLEEVVDIDEVLRYFVVHNFVLNFDSYTGSMIHNYYLREADGQLSMIAWDYNLAFGGFGMGGSAVDTATSLVNYPIDTPVSGGSMDDRPMIGQLLGDETCLAQYHELFDAFISAYFESGYFAEMYGAVVSLISPYVKEDPTAFCTHDEFLAATENLRAFCLLRAESIRGQLDGSIPATSEGQAADASALIDGSAVNVQAMGSQDGFGGNRDGGGFGANRQGRSRADGEASDGNTSATVTPTDTATTANAPEALPATAVTAAQQQAPAGFTPPDGAALPEGMPTFTGEMPEGMPAMPGGEMRAEAGTEESTEPGSDPEATDAPQRQSARQAPGGMMPGSAQQPDQSPQQYWLLGIAAVILLAGLLFAARYKR